MKNLLTIALLFVITLGVDAQSVNNDLIGTWRGSLERTDTDGETTAQLVIYKEGGRLVCRRQFVNDDSELYNANRGNSSTIAQENNLTYSWVNNGGVWSESQTYFCSITTDGDNDETLYVYHIRLVNNDKIDDSEDDVWGYEEIGLFYRQ